MENDRTRLYLIHPEYKYYYNFDSPNWLMEQPFTLFGGLKDLRIVFSLAAGLNKHSNDIIDAFVEEVKACQCDLAIIDHRLLIDSGWEYPEDTGKLVFFVSSIQICRQRQ